MAEEPLTQPNPKKHSAPGQQQHLSKQLSWRRHPSLSLLLSCLLCTWYQLKPLVRWNTALGTVQRLSVISQTKGGRSKQLNAKGGPRSTRLLVHLSYVRWLVPICLKEVLYVMTASARTVDSLSKPANVVSRYLGLLKKNVRI